MVKEAYDFPTELKSIMLVGGKKIPDRKAVVRTDNNTVLGIVGSDYKIVPHKTVIETFENIKTLERERLDLCHKGAVLLARYNIGETERPVAKGDVVRFQLRVFNSMNSSFGVGFELVALRLVCTNGLVVPKSISRLSFKHFNNANVNELPELINRRLINIAPTVNTWKDWLNIHPAENRITEYFKEIKMGERLQKELLPKAVEDAERNGVWGIFNTLTYHITHDIKIRGTGENKALSQRTREQEWLPKFYDFKWN